MKILLITPPGRSLLSFNYPIPPLGILYLASSIRQDGNHEVTVLDCFAKKMSLKSLLRYIKKNPVDALGISFTTDARFSAFDTATAVKEEFPEITIIGGGPHVTVAAEDTLKHIKAFDVAVRVEGEITLVDTLNTLGKGKSLEKVEGITYRSGDKIISNQNRKVIPKLDVIPFPAWDLIDLDTYNQHTRGYFRRDNYLTTSVVSNRGCPGNCSFCYNNQVWGRIVRVRSVQNFLDEIELLYSKYGVRHFRFSDDTFNITSKRVIQVCDEIRRRGLKFTWECHLRADQVSCEMLQHMKDTGCNQVTYGVESVNDETLHELIGKRITIEQVDQMAAWCRELDILYVGGYIISFPDETIEEMYNTVNHMKKIGGKTGLNILKIYPGTQIEKIARERGVLPEGFSWGERKWTYQDSLPALSGAIPYYIDKISWDELQKVLFIWAKMNNIGLLKPLWLSIIGIRSVNDVYRLFQLGLNYIKSRCMPVSKSCKTAE
jgi:magnesium-protoporphyrin IX monomethyl ester (oxidative) cyclase